MKTERKELKLDELEQVNGGIFPFLIVGAIVLAAATYEAYKVLKKD